MGNARSCFRAVEVERAGFREKAAVAVVEDGEGFAAEAETDRRVGAGDPHRLVLLFDLERAWTGDPGPGALSRTESGRKQDHGCSSQALFRTGPVRVPLTIRFDRPRTRRPAGSPARPDSMRVY